MHTLTQNTRGLPERSQDAVGANVVLDDTYDYDYNGNVAAITDGLPGAPGDRGMTYDALDRLVGVEAGSAQGGNGVFAYDPLDNLRVLDQGARQFRYTYSAKNHLANIKTPAGTTLFVFSYDGRGNQLTRSGPATFTWDRAERLVSTSLGTSSYVYDGLGRRVRATAGGLVTDSYYGQAGTLLFQRRPTKTVNYIHLAGSLVGERAVPVGGGAETNTYQHTDALGTPVAETDAAGNEILASRERMTAYGEPADGSNADGPGYTGHVTDAASELTYMQQRYYDPAIGRFLSVDPVGIDDNWDMRHFNRYAYGYNNPYRFTDPDGRCPLCLVPFVIGLLTYSEPANAPAPGETPISNSPGDALAAALPPARALAPLRMAVGAGKDKTHTTYTREKSDGTVYSGRTSGTGAPEQQIAARTRSPDHQQRTAEGYGPATVDRNSPNADAIRGREQQLIQQNGGAQSQGGTSGNAINGVAPSNPKAEQYQSACTTEFGC